LISQATIEDFFQPNEVLNSSESGFKIAFGVESYVDRVSKDDPEYVEWVVSLISSTSGVKQQTPLRIHKCNEQDYQSFYPHKRTTQKFYE